ncbi:MAG: WG repeat-containing protein [Muribaculaceae bacterium]|nr:WG repeat-containing protein [Muribaculaceae bacterium]
MSCALLLLLASCSRDGGDYPFATRYLPVQLVGSDKWSILDVSTGQVLARDAFAQVPSAVVNDMFCVMNDNGTFDYYNVSAPTQRVNDESYGSATPFSDDGVAVASRRGGPLMVIDKQCQPIRELPRHVAQCTMFYRGRAAYQTDDGLWGYIDQQGDTVIAARYASAHPFLHSDLAVVVQAGQPGDTAANFSVIDKQGRECYHASSSEYRIIQPCYVSGVLPVVKGDSMVCLGGDGREVPNPNDNHQAVDQAGYQHYSRTPAGFFVVVKNGKMGLVDHENHELIAAQWDRLVDVTADRYIAVTDTVCQLVDRQGRAVGDARFVHVHGSVDDAQAARGFLDTSLAAASMLLLLSPEQCCGATPATTLMDMNRALQGPPEDYLAQQQLTTNQGAFVIQYLFGDTLATVPTPGAPAEYNYGARVAAVTVTLNVRHCGLRTEQDVVEKLSSALGTRGFVLEGDGVFASQAGTALALGYDRGLVKMHYFMRSADAHPLGRNARQ